MKIILFAVLIPFALFAQDVFGGGFFSNKPTHETRSEYNSSTVQTPTGSQTTSSSRVRTWNRAPQYAPSYSYYAPSSGGQPNDINLGKPVADVIGAVGSVISGTIRALCLWCSGNSPAQISARQEYYRPPEPQEPIIENSPAQPVEQKEEATEGAE